MPRPSRPRRRPAAGRPSRSPSLPPPPGADRARTVTQILDAAEALFARQGFTGTTIKTIGRDAGVNPALLYYYFQGKAQLYHAVLERRLHGLASGSLIDLDPALPPLEAIGGILQGYARTMRAAPMLPRLIARELADHEAAHALPLIREIAAGLFQRLCDLIRVGQQAGQIRRDLEPRFAAVSAIAQLAWFFVAQPAVSRLLGFEGAVPGPDQDRFTHHAIAFARAALSTPEATAGASS